MKPKTFWEYCGTVAGRMPMNGKVNQNRMVMEDIEAVAICFDREWNADECAETLKERRDSLRL